MKEQLYNDFINNVLPKIQQGLTLSYDYFLDLFGRYVTYLFVTDVITATLCFAAGTGLSFVILSKRYKDWVSEQSDDYNPLGYISMILMAVTALFMFGMAIDSTFDAIKAKYVPEIRVYEEIQHMKNMNNSN